MLQTATSAMMDSLLQEFHEKSICWIYFQFGFFVFVFLVGLFLAGGWFLKCILVKKEIGPHRGILKVKRMIGNVQHIYFYMGTI